MVIYTSAPSDLDKIDNGYCRSLHIYRTRESFIDLVMVMQSTTLSTASNLWNSLLMEASEHYYFEVKTEEN